MAYPPIPEPLNSVLRNVLHANMFAGWQAELYEWIRAHRDQEETLRRQLAQAALNDVTDPDLFLRRTGHWVEDPATTQAWFATLFNEFYGRRPQPYDIADPTGGTSRSP